MVYCMSDIHGEIDRFHKMLEMIHFSDSDTLYIIGDVIDRGAGGIDILRDIIHKPNIVLLRGNHEQMMLDVFGPNSVYGSKSLWLNNGGSCTYIDWTSSRDSREKERIIKYLLDTVDHVDVEVNGKKLHLVHGCPGDTAEDRLWKRPEWYMLPFFEDRTVILGHTPTGYFRKHFLGEARIYHGDGFIGIDCWCGLNYPGRKLACLRLDDMAEFYV